MAAPTRIDVSADNNVRIIRFRDRQLTDDPTVRAVTDQIFASLPTDKKPFRLLLDFSGVDHVSSSLLGKMILLQRRVEAAGGKLRICELSNPVLNVFKTTNLNRLFGIDRDRRESLEAFETS